MLVTRNGKVQWGNYDQTLNIAAGAAVTLTITPPIGELWRIKNLYISLPVATGATAGTQNLNIGIGSVNSAKNFLIDARSNFGDVVRLRNGTIDLATNLKIPSTEQGYQATLAALTVTNESPLILYVLNNTTGGTQNGTINITVVREVEYVA